METTTTATKKEATELGLVTMNYDANGKVISADFAPSIMTMDVNAMQLGQQLVTINKPVDAEAINKNARNIFASWFNQMVQIEMADIETHVVSSEVVECIKYDDGTPKKCVIKFLFVEF